MKAKKVTLKRVTMLLFAVMATTAMSWAGIYNVPQVFDEASEEVAAPPPAFNGHMLGASFNLSPAIVGDVDRDGALNTGDLTVLINALLTGDFKNLNSDVDGDGRTSVGDVTNLINRLLQGVVETRLSVIELAAAMNDVYKSMRSAAWTTTGNFHQAFGISAYTLAGEVMGDDMMMGAQGSGWFWYDAAYSVKSRYTSSSWRSHDLWNAYYTWIAEANSIISQANQIAGDAGLVNYYVGQAYALRAYSYFMLAQWFARTYKGHESDPCVPIFNGTTFNGSTGALRSTVAQVYAQIDADINMAISKLEGTTQLEPQHMSYAVAQGLRSRIKLVEENWSTAYLAAKAAIAAFEGEDSRIQEVSDFMGMNDVTAGNVMWGIDIPESESQMYASLYAHMCSNFAYGERAPKQITNWLYNKMIQWRVRGRARGRTDSC